MGMQDYERMVERDRRGARCGGLARDADKPAHFDEPPDVHRGDGKPDDRLDPVAGE